MRVKIEKLTVDTIVLQVLQERRWAVETQKGQAKVVCAMCVKWRIETHFGQIDSVLHSIKSIKEIKKIKHCVWQK